MKTKRLDYGYLDQMAAQLQARAADGRALPGFGGAAAVSGLIAIEMMLADYHSKTFASQYQAAVYSLAEIKELLEEDYRPKLIEYFRRDLLLGPSPNQLSDSRPPSPAQKKKSRLGKEELENLKAASRIPIEVCRTCLAALRLALEIYYAGFRSVHGGTGVVLSNLHLAIADSYTVLLLNSKTLPPGNWLEELKVEAARLWQEYQAVRLIALKSVTAICAEKA